MAEVPGAQYEPYFTAQPTERPIQLRGVDVSEGAFGGNIANALGVFGRGVTEGSNEVFNRAMALRRLQIDGQIRDMTTDYYNEVVPLETDFLTKRGNDAGPEAQTAYLANVERVRQKYLEQAKQFGVYGADKFGNEAASMQRSFIRNAATHSATETKTALKNSYIAHNDALADQAGSARTPEELNPIIDQTKENQRQIDTMNGITDTFERKWNERIAVSKAITKNTKGRMERDPTNATVIGDAAVKSKDTTYDDKEVIRREGESLIPKAADLYHRNLLAGKDISLGERKIDPTRLVNAIVKMGGAPTNLPIWLKEAGMPEMTEEQYLNDPKAQRQLIEFKLNQFQEQTGTANGAVNMWFTGNATPSSSVGIGYLNKFNSILAQNATAKELGAAVEEHIKSIGGENETFPDVAIRYRQHIMDRQAQEERRDRLGIAENQVAIGDAIKQGSPDTGKPYRDYVDFSNNPANAQIIAKGMETDPKFEEHTSRMINGRNKAFLVQTDEQHKHDLYVEMDQKPNEFMKRNFYDDPDLSTRDQDHFHNLRATLVRRGFVDPNINRVYNDLLAKFPTEVPRKDEDPQGFKNYRGRLFPAVQAWEEVNKKQLKPGTPDGNKGMDEIHETLMQQTPGFFGYFKNRAYNVEPEVPEEWEKAARLANPQITDGEIRYAWIKGQSVAEFERMYAKDTKGGPSSANLRPTTVRSSLPATPSTIPAKPTPPEPKGPSAAQVAQDNPVIKALQQLTTSAMKELMASGSPEAVAEEAKVRQLGAEPPAPAPAKTGQEEDVKELFKGVRGKPGIPKPVIPEETK